MGAIIKRNNIDFLNLVERGKRTITSASLSQGMLTDDTVKFSVAANSKLDIKINDTVEVFGNTYRINTLPTFKKISNSSYAYEIEAQGLMYDLLRCKFFNADATGFKTTTNFPLIGNLEVFLTAVKNNMSRFSNLWEIGTFATTETKMIIFGDDTCLSALQKICQEFKTDFWVKTEGGKFKIHTGEFGSTLPIQFEYGKGKGLYSLSRENIDDNGIVNRLYVNGGSNNIPAGYRNFSDNLKFSDAGYLEDTALIAEIGLKEGSIEFPEIYPKRTGEITALGSTKFKFKDSTMDFDLNEKNEDGSTKYLIAGTSAKIHFNTGNLAGYEFEIKKSGYNTATKEFEIIPFKNESGQKFPDENALAFQFSVNDEYVLLDIVMPQTYVTNAETELLTKGTEQFNLNKTAKVSYDLDIDPEYIKNLTTPISIGDYVRVKDSALGIDKVIRVQSITRNFITANAPTPYNYKITLADSYEINYASQMILDIKDIKNVVNITNLGNINLSQLGYKTTEELRNLVFDTDGYFDSGNIKPFSIQTNMLSVGAQSQQLSCSVVFSVNDSGIVNKVDSKAGVLFSQTFNKSWNISALNTTIPDNNFRYVYAKCSKVGSSGTIFYTQSQIKFDEDPNDYYFLLGILHTVTEGVRVLSITIGTTTINGGLIRTGIVSSLDGLTTLNLNTGEIKGKITFTNDSPAFQQVNDAIVIGGRNYLRNSGNFTTTEFWNVYDSAVRSIENGTLKMIGDATGLPRVFNNKYIKLDTAPQQWIFTVEYNSNNFIQGIGGKFGATETSGEQGSWDAVLLENVNLGNWNRKSTFKWNSPVYSNSTPSFWVYFYLLNNQQVNLKFIKVEKGTKSTDWTPAPEDIDSAIEGANTNSANALAQAQNAQNTANSAAAVTNFMQTTVDGNVVNTGTLQVGSATGANAGITGVVDKPNRQSVRFWAGAPYAGKETAPWNLRENGFMTFNHPNGKVAFEFGLENGKFVMNGYHESGLKIFQLSPNRGLVNVAYIQEGWLTTSLININQSSFTLDESLARNFIVNRITFTATGDTNESGEQFYMYSILPNFSCFEYFAGTHPDNLQYEVLNGYKDTYQNRVSNITDGWYGLNYGELGGNFGYVRPTFKHAYVLYCIQGGKVTKTQIVNIEY